MTHFRLACAYHNRGAPAGKVEDALTTLTQHYGLESHWAVTPGSIHANFGDPFDINSISYE